MHIQLPVQTQVFTQRHVPIMTPSADFDGHWEQILWSDDLVTGHDGIDADHRKLLALFNEFAMAVNADRGDTLIRTVLDDLVDYTHYHFKREESLMLGHGFPDYDLHKKMHDTFIRQIDDVHQHLSVSSHMSAFLLSFLAKWLSGHIMVSDRKLGQFLEQRGVAEG